ncbi:tRNA (N(6)-L-threonylcarbamoyladenosine(37)-C(2))-methylthiotransferase MtaB [Bartonella sp. DGB1]|uniref:tRNA (N(6)-L-threonylcarbamoyladenosine(37)-C(2))- methylthiotransferase MtaB n=1 Tax=Bartonella sp. DGB1 TaxID=3239807 RepID=UPI00352664F8
MSIKVVTFGCRLNIVETEVIKQEAQKANLDKLDNETYIFNTCAVTEEAVRQAKQSIRKTRRENPNANIIVTGCAAQADIKQFTDMEAIDLIIGNEDKLHASSYKQLPDFGFEQYEKIRVNDIMSVKETAGHLLNSVEGKTRAFVQIQNGCDHRCTFCIIPYGRGPSRSVPIGVIVQQISNLCKNGYKEVVLTGVDLTSYGLDLPGKSNLAKLIKIILKEIPELPRLRLSSLDSIEINDSLLELLINETRIMPHIHLSLQAGDDLILKRMKRRHLRQNAIDFCTNLKKQRPEIIFGADFIAGFPTETEEMFQQTLKLVDECQITYLHVFPYSARTNTPAAKMPQVEKTIIKERAKRLRELGKEKLQLFFQSEIGKTKNILVENNNIGRTENYALTELTENFQQGTIIKAKITGYNHNRLTAIPIFEEKI